MVLNFAKKIKLSHAKQFSPSFSYWARKQHTSDAKTIDIGSVSKFDQNYLSHVQMTDSTQTKTINDNSVQLYSVEQITINISNRAFMVKHLNFNYILVICYKH